MVGMNSLWENIFSSSVCGQLPRQIEIMENVGAEGKLERRIIKPTEGEKMQDWEGRKVQGKREETEK